MFFQILIKSPRLSELLKQIGATLITLSTISKICHKASRQSTSQRYLATDVMKWEEECQQKKQLKKAI